MSETTETHEKLPPKLRKIIHIDMDCFYAAVEIRDNPSLRGKPVAVGGSADRRGVLTTASYEARKYGLRSAMATSRALKLCPDLILLPVNFEKYRTESRRVQAILRQYTEQIEPLSLDEAYLDVTESDHCGGVATQMAREIRQKIFSETGLTASAGIAPNKFLAKVASDWRKPNGQMTVAPEKVDEFVRGLKVEKIPGVGKVTAAKMHGLRLFTCADLQKLSPEILQRHFGSWGQRLFEICRGVDHRKVSDEGERKSLTVENTFDRDLKSLEECVSALPELFEDFERRIGKTGILNGTADEVIKGLVVKIKFFDFKQTTVESCLIRRPSLEGFEHLLRVAHARGGKPVRLIGIGVRLMAKKSVESEGDRNQLSLDLG
jgi:DNA polymerase-4